MSSPPTMSFAELKHQTSKARVYGDLARWPYPKPSATSSNDPEEVDLLKLTPLPITLLPVQIKYLNYVTFRYGFDNPSETIRHLIFHANFEQNTTKRIIFKVIRCFHCGVGSEHHSKLNPVPEDEPIEVYTFQKMWIDKVCESCSIKDEGKVLRIIFDYYMSMVKAAVKNQGEMQTKSQAAEVFDKISSGGVVDESFAVESKLFTSHREYDSRVALAEERYTLSLDGTTTEREAVKILSEEASTLVGACSATATSDAMKTCQVGRGSGSYALALNETSDETRARRKKEEAYENTEEFKKARAEIAKQLGSVMG